MARKSKARLFLENWDDTNWVKDKSMKDKGYRYALKHTKSGDIRYFKSYSDIDSFGPGWVMIIL